LWSGIGLIYGIFHKPGTGIQYGLFLLGAIVCAYRAIVSKRILSATIYLACISALVSAAPYLMGAAQVAVMELSISVVGDDALDPESLHWLQFMRKRLSIELHKINHP
jgi:uncharacterized MnhB-related membrane protein